jgi:hypothetical protein
VEARIEMLRVTLLCLTALSASTAFSLNHGLVHDLQFKGKNNLYAKKSSSSRSTSNAITMMAQRRVVVTGMGITSCLGNTLDDVANSLKEAK